ALEVHASAGPDVPVAVEKLAALDVGQRLQEGQILRVGAQQFLVVVYAAADEGEADGRQVGELLEQFPPGRAPDHLVVDHHEVADDTAALRYGEAVRPDPPVDKAPD